MKSMIYLFLFSFMIFTSIYAQSEKEIIQTLFNQSNDITVVANNIVSLSIDAVWLASELAGTVALTGTLTQNSNNYWSYSNSPTDKLILAYADGSAIEFKFDTINGYDEGTADDFKDSHSMDFTTYIQNYINLRIISTANPVAEKIYYSNKISGTIFLDGEENTLNIEHTFNKFYEIGNGFAQYIYNDVVTGISNTPTKTYTLNDQYYIIMMHNSNQGQFVKNAQRWSNSSLAINSNTYAFSGLNVFWAGGTQLADSANVGIYNNVIDDYQWIAEGSVLKNNQVYGSIIFSTSVINYTSGPYLIASLISGENIILHYLLNQVPTSVPNNNEPKINNYSLEQNYPNPFNPTTTIKYSIPNNVKSETVNVKLIVYDILGNEVATLVNEKKSAGNYEVKFNASNLASGIYLYKLQSGSFVQTKKFVLMK